MKQLEQYVNENQFITSRAELENYSNIKCVNEGIFSDFFSWLFGKSKNDDEDTSNKKVKGSKSSKEEKYKYSQNEMSNMNKNFKNEEMGVMYKSEASDSTNGYLDLEWRKDKNSIKEIEKILKSSADTVFMNIKKRYRAAQQGEKNFEYFSLDGIHGMMGAVKCKQSNTKNVEVIILYKIEKKSIVVYDIAINNCVNKDIINYGQIINAIRQIPDKDEIKNLKSIIFHIYILRNETKKNKENSNMLSFIKTKLNGTEIKSGSSSNGFNLKKFEIRI